MKTPLLPLRKFYLLSGAILLSACGGTQLVQTPMEQIDQVPLKVAELTETEKQRWNKADLTTDTIPGMSVDRAYAELLGKLKSKTVVVAVIDTGIDLEHEDLDGVLWTNRGERPGNGKDDDNNGYVDDVHGYNFLGESHHEQMEAARILRLKLGDASLQARARQRLEADRAETQSNKQRYEQILQAVENADKAVKAHLKKDSYTKSDVMGIKTTDQTLAQHVSVLRQMYSFEDSIDAVMEQLRDGITYFTGRLNYHFNVDFNGREVVGDNPYDFSDRAYGNGDPSPKEASEDHGTHVAGIIAAERNNGKGVQGVADDVEIMSLRAIPDGDEYDKDIALAIRYAVDNGASIINASFGKPFSPNSEWVKEALAYAAENDVLFVQGSGNDALDLDKPENLHFPHDQVGTGPEYVNNVLTVGSLDSDYGSEVVSSFSNYGGVTVDIFAPGGDVYSTVPFSKYEYLGGTSMASPGVAGIAAVLRSRYPNFSAAEIKQIIMDSGLTLKTPVVLGEGGSVTRPFAEASKSGKIANLYNALILAEKVSKGVESLSK